MDPVNEAPAPEAAPIEAPAAAAEATAPVEAPAPVAEAPTPDPVPPAAAPEPEAAPVEAPAPAAEAPIPPATEPEAPAPAAEAPAPVDPAPLIPPNTPDSDTREFGGPGTGWSLRFQNGAKELGRNGATSEEVIDALLEHFGFFQKGKYACAENAEVIKNLEAAKAVIQKRAADRAARGVLGRAAK